MYKNIYLDLPISRNNIIKIKNKIKLIYEYPYLHKKLNSICIIVLKTKQIRFRIFCDGSGALYLKKHEIKEPVEFATVFKY